MLTSLAAEPYEHRGIIHSEMALVLHALKRLRIERVIESGRARAQSTWIMATYLPHLDIHSVEMRDDEDARFGRERVGNLRNVTLYEGDGRELVPMLAWLDERPTAVLLDGPKGEAAVAILEQCFKRQHVRIGFIHDMRRLDHGGPSPHRAAAVERLPKHLFSDEPALIEQFSWLDGQVIAAGGPVGAAHEAEFGSYGPTIGMFLNPSAISTKQGSASCP